MKPSFVHRLVNAPFEDPSLFVRIMREKRAFLFDIGNISKLAPAELQKITDVFVTHTHIDHFIGFDTLMRAVLRRDIPLRIYGPSNITSCIEGKMKGYAWNLIREYPLKIIVLSVEKEMGRRSVFDAADCFERREDGDFSFDGTLMKESNFTIKALPLSHQIPCLAFSLEEEFHINIDKALLSERNLTVGPWLSGLKSAMREKKSGDTEFVIAGRTYRLEELSRIARITEGQKISYVTDVDLVEENISRIIDFVRGSDTLYCEAYFMEKDREMALRRHHLTARISGRIAREAGVRQFVPIHFSPRYRNKDENPGDEAMKEFRKISV